MSEHIGEYDFAVQLARDAGEMLKAASAGAFETMQKGADERDVVTSVDLEINTFLIAKIHQAFPTHAISSEEGGGTNAEAGEYEWLLDPVDGSANFARSIPHFAVCIALLKAGVPFVGAVYNPMTDELFSFEQGHGAFVNGTKIQVSAIDEPGEAQGILVVGHQAPLWDWGAATYRSLLEHLKKLKAFGSSGLDLCFVAAGRADVVVYGTLSTRDAAAAIGIVREAGGEVYTLGGVPVAFTDARQTIIATNNKKLFEKVQPLLRQDLLPS